MLVIANIVILIGLVKLLVETEKPFVCAGIFTVIRFLFALGFGCGLVAALGVAAVACALACMYFWLLDRFQGAGVVWWLILIAGLLLGMV